jgi:hypothetical protein
MRNKRITMEVALSLVLLLVLFLLVLLSLLPLDEDILASSITKSESSS